MKFASAGLLAEQQHCVRIVRSFCFRCRQPERVRNGSEMTGNPRCASAVNGGLRFPSCGGSGSPAGRPFEGERPWRPRPMRSDRAARRRRVTGSRRALARAPPPLWARVSPGAPGGTAPIPGTPRQRVIRKEEWRDQHIYISRVTTLSPSVRLLLFFL